MTLKVIAYARNGHTDKFGIPRQSREDSPILTRIVFEPDYNVPEALRGIEGYSHLWIIWGANLTPTLSTREGVYIGESGRMELIVSGADVLDGTPIYDIKPYLSFSDSHPESKNGFAEETKDYHLEVRFEEFWIGNNQYEISTKPVHNTDKVEIFPKKVLEDITYILRQDPRPAYQDDPEREYKMDYAGFTITFVVKDTTVIVKKIDKM